MKGMFHRHRRRYPSQRSAALIFALAMIVLVAVAVLAFFSSATLNLHIETSRANRTKADLLADSGGDYAIASIISQITDPNRSTITTVSGVSIYEPRFATNAMIQRGAFSLTVAKNPTFFNLVQQSVPAMDTNSSGDSTTLAASNGRTLDTNRWNEPHLLTGSGFTASTQLPNWIYVNRTNGPTTMVTGDVIGRFAYNIYNTGQLLDANVAGYPSSTTAIPALMTDLKGGEIGADLTKLTNNNAITIPQSSIDTLMSFRFPDNPSATNYVGRMLGAATNGYLAVQNNDWFQGTSFTENMFNSRQDLIRYVTTQNPVLTNALPYLTHFSRAIDAPSYKAPATSSNPDIPNIRVQVAGTITHYDDQGGTSTYTVSVGDPLVQRRFSLAKLAWLTPTGPLSGISAAAIQSCFGLSWNATQERWDYMGPTGSTMQSSIETLAQIAAEGAPREPNFFETLKAGILSNTLGGAATAGCDYFNGTTTQCTNGVSLCPAANNTLDANKDLHIIQIGANIVDCAETNSYPTRIGMQFGPVVIEKAGVADLPYFYSVDMPVFMQANAATDTSGTNVWNCPTLAFMWVPELYEPHRPTTNTYGPTSIQINFLPNSILYQAGFAQNTAFSAGISTSVLNRDLSTLAPISVSSNNFSNFRNGPQPVRSAGAANSLGQLIPSFFTTNADVLAFQFANYANASDFPPGLPVQITQKPYLGYTQVQNVIMRLQYMTPGGQLKTYATLGGNEALPNTTGIWGANRDDFGTTPAPIPILKNTDGLNNNGFLATTPGQSTTLNYINSCRLVPYDPRGSRFGPGNGHYRHFLAQTPLFTLNGPAGNPEDFSSATFYPTTYYTPTVPGPGNTYMGNLPQFTAFQDGDGVARLPDAAYGNYNSVSGIYGNGNITTNSANPYVNVTNSSGYPARPVILNRPFQSVAELGYVYRDVPWESLNFFNNTGGDSPLLDLFSVNDEPAVTAGRVFLATEQLPVESALLSGITQEPDGTLPFPNATAQAVASAIYNFNYSALGRPNTGTGTFPGNIADMANFMNSSLMTTPGGTNSLGVSLIKNRREAIVRALASTTQMRTWNILVDMVAQTGRFPGKSFTAGDFLVEGESHIWISVAIDRYTGKIVDEQIEKVNE